MRKLMISLLLILMLVISGASFAQDAPCGNLDDANCTLLNESAAAMNSLSSATFDLSIDITLSEMSDGSDGTFSITADGAFNGDLSGLDPAALSNTTMSAEESIELAKTVLTSFNGELNLGLAAPEQGLPEGLLSFELTLVDGIGYLNFESLGLLLGGPESLEAMGLPTGWGGLDLIDVIEQATAMAGDLSELDEAMGGADQMAMQEDVMALTNDYLIIERLDDEEGLAVFATSFDFAGMFADEAFVELLVTSMGGDMEGISEEEMAEGIALLQALANELNLLVTQKINPDTKFVESTTIALSADLGAVSDVTGGSDTGIISVSGTFSMSDFNSAPEIAAPEGAPVATFMDLMSLAGSMGGGF